MSAALSISRLSRAAQTGRGTVMPLKPRPVEYSTSFFRSPAGAERGIEPAW